MEIPKSFKCAGFTIDVDIVEKLPSNNYGEFCDVSNIIKLAKTVNIEGFGSYCLSRNQIENTFYHELIHVFQYYYNNEYNEAQAQVFANFIQELLNTKQ